MTIWNLLAACRRRWLVVCVGLVVTLGSFIWVDRVPGVYWARSDVMFLAPSSTRFPNSFSSGSGSLVTMAGIIQRDLNLDSGRSESASDGVSLADEGVRDGEIIRLPNTGGQWAFNFESPILNVQAVGSSPDEVGRRIHDLQSRIAAALDYRQNQAGVDQINRIYLQVSPSSVEVQYLAGDRKRALAVTATLGLALTLAVVVVVDGQRVRRRGLHIRRGRHPALDNEAGRSSMN